MDSLPQELIDKIIDNLPRSSLLSCSLVAKRWRRRSQQRAFQEIKLSSEHKVNCWCIDIPQDMDGIASYVHAVKFKGIGSWYNPATLGLTLKGLGSLTKLWVFGTVIPDEVPAQISRGEFGREITTLTILFPPCTLATIVSMILSLPNLKTLCVTANGIVSGEPLSTHPASPQKGPLDLLQLRGDVSALVEALAKFRFISRRLSLGVYIPGIEQLITCSSETVVELNLCEGPPREVIPPLVHLPPLPALTTLGVSLCTYKPSPRLANIMCRIPPTPKLASVTIGYYKWFKPDADIEGLEHPFQGRWVDIDRWLAQMAGHAVVQLPMTLARWPEDKPAWNGFLYEFRKAGGEIKITADDGVWDDDDGWYGDGISSWNDGNGTWDIDLH